MPLMQPKGFELGSHSSRHGAQPLGYIRFAHRKWIGPYIKQMDDVNWILDTKMQTSTCSPYQAAEGWFLTALWRCSGLVKMSNGRCRSRPCRRCPRWWLPWLQSTTTSRFHAPAPTLSRRWTRVLRLSFYKKKILGCCGNWRGTQWTRL